MGVSCRGERDLSLSRASASGEYVVSLRSESEPIPLNALHSWLACIRRADGAPVADAIVTVDGGMPEHRHGLPTRPEVTGSPEPGCHRIEGMKFSMSGHWVLTVTFWVANKRDSAQFDLELP